MNHNHFCRKQPCWPRFLVSGTLIFLWCLQEQKLSYRCVCVCVYMWFSCMMKSTCLLMRTASVSSFCKPQAVFVASMQSFPMNTLSLLLSRFLAFLLYATRVIFVLWQKQSHRLLSFDHPKSLLLMLTTPLKWFVLPMETLSQPSSGHDPAAPTSTTLLQQTMWRSTLRWSPLGILLSRNQWCRSVVSNQRITTSIRAQQRMVSLVLGKLVRQLPSKLELSVCEISSCDSILLNLPNYILLTCFCVVFTEELKIVPLRRRLKRLLHLAKSPCWWWLQSCKE